MKSRSRSSALLATLLVCGLLLCGFATVGARAQGAAGMVLGQSVGLEERKLVLGWLENIRMYPGGMIMRAKLDSGARSNAIHAENIEMFQGEDGRRMVRFTILKDHDDPGSERIDLVKPVERVVNIKLRYTTIRDQRPVVRLDFCIAGLRHEGLFSLTERSDFLYPVLLGREFLQNHIIIDPSETFTHRTGCRRTL
jgi:hypothetical protein